MTKRLDFPGVTILIVEPTEPEDCELCGKTAELRPYGPNGENICYECGQKDVAGTERKLREVLFGIKEDQLN